MKTIMCVTKIDGKEYYALCKSGMAGAGQMCEPISGDVEKINYALEHGIEVLETSKTSREIAQEKAAAVPLPKIEKKFSEFTHEDLDKFPKCRVFSVAGPCITFYHAIRKNKKSWTVAFKNGNEVSFDTVHAVHFDACRSCEDHPATQYPNGYED